MRKTMRWSDLARLYTKGRIVMSEHEGLVEILRHKLAPLTEKERDKAAAEIERLSASLAAMEKREDGLREALWLFREFVIQNATQWQTGAGHHHPIWAMVAELVGEMGGITSGPHYEFIQPDNRTALQAKDGEADHCGIVQVNEADFTREGGEAPNYSPEQIQSLKDGFGDI